jgi:hypothetical protein
MQTLSFVVGHEGGHRLAVRNAPADRPTGVNGDRTDGASMNLREAQEPVTGAAISLAREKATGASASSASS